MGTKRRSMFNPKFKKVRPDRWNLGRKMLGIPTEEELEAIKLAEENEARLKVEAELEATRLLKEQEEARLKAEEEAKVKLQAATKARLMAEKEKKTDFPKTKTKTTNRTARTRKTRAKKE